MCNSNDPPVAAALKPPVPSVPEPPKTIRKAIFGTLGTPIPNPRAAARERLPDARIESEIPVPSVPDTERNIANER